MKKNRMMRVASILLVAVLLSTSVISGTFAKYVTTASGTDNARVAKWGIVLDVNGKLFEDSYLSKTNGNTPGGNSSTGLTVLANADAGDIANGDHNKDRVVAPGTKNDTGMTFSIKGTAETAVKVEIKLQKAEDDPSAPQDIFLKAGTYRDWTVADQDADYEGTFSNASDYYPVKFTLVEQAASGAYTIAGAASAAGVTVDTTDPSKPKITGTLADMQKVFNKLNTLMTQVNPNYVFDNTFTLTWEWDFDASGAGTYDRQDTLLGNLAAGTGTKADGTTFEFKDVSKLDTSSGGVNTWKAMETTDYNLNTGFYFNISVTQVD